jgi:Eukaryotic translation initiation factor eIF2A.
MKKLILILSMGIMPVQAVVIGSDSAVSRQSKSFFKKSESLSNTMKGFSVFEKGIVLEDADTTVLFDAFFPVSGDVVLNGGTLSLMGDIAFKNPFRIGVGKIQGNGYALELPRNLSYLDFPSFYYLKLIANLLDTYNLSSQVYSLDWNYNDQYVAVALKGANGVAELQILSFNGKNFSVVASQDFGTTTLNCVRWHPSSNYLVTAGAAGIELKTWFFNSANNTITEVSNDDIGIATAVQWNHSGSHVAVGRKNSDELLVYPVADGELGTPKIGSFGNTLQVQNNALSWHSSDEYIAVGVSHAAQSQDIYLFSFNGAAVSLLNSINTGASANALSWIPNNCPTKNCISS